MKRFFENLRRLEFFLGAAGLSLSVILTFCQVLNRYWLHYEIMWIGDMALFIFIFTIYVAISYGAALKTHICVDILPDAITQGNERKKALYDIFKSAATVVMVLSMAPATWKVVKRSFQYPEYATLVRWFNMSWLVYAMGAMVVLVALHYAWHICEDVFLIRKSLWLEQNEKTVSRDD